MSKLLTHLMMVSKLPLVAFLRYPSKFDPLCQYLDDKLGLKTGPWEVQKDIFQKYSLPNQMFLLHKVNPLVLEFVQKDDQFDLVPANNIFRVEDLSLRAQAP